ncbi:hypothetical protein POM88_048465 [Heracleum sosnowskyi]|uniref:Uncharacterized protein n=1 Tax=Heracleum sosnowskyi TaxID=360622 RepID=A0AAD8GVD7_9APIA|nr:hypothetical protein POM88_048465 [Heracleum sosnowskyi]
MSGASTGNSIVPSLFAKVIPKSEKLIVYCAELFLHLRLATCPVMSKEAIHTTLPNLRVHSLRTSMLQNYKNDTYVTHLNNTNHPSPYHLVRLQEEANEPSKLKFLKGSLRTYSVQVWSFK